MADYVEFTLAQTAFKFGVGQDWTRQLRDNFINHEDRIKALEANSLVFEHFNFHEELSSFSPPPGIFTNSPHNIAFSRHILNTGITNTAWLMTSRVFRYDTVTKPLTFFARIKKLEDSNMKIGLYIFRDPASSAFPSDARGIWLEKVDASNWRFVSFDTARTNGSNFAKPTDNTWFTVEIEFTDTPSARALCRVDTVLKETLTTQLPTGAGDLHVIIACTAIASGNIAEVDKLSYGPVALLDEA